jgi:hypothetical protein
METAKGSVAEEHFLAFYLRNKLGARFHHRARSETGPRLLLAGLPGEYHEIALLLFALSANSQGFRLLTLGANMPLEELTVVASRTDCDAIVLSGAIKPSPECCRRPPRLVSAVGPVYVVGRLRCRPAMQSTGRREGTGTGHGDKCGLFVSAQLRGVPAVKVPHQAGWYDMNLDPGRKALPNSCLSGP